MVGLMLMLTEDGRLNRCKKDQDMVMMVMVIFAGVPT